MSKIDVPELGQKIIEKAKQFVTIPELDLYDHVFPTIRVNHFEFHAGKTYELAHELAETVKERIHTYQKMDLRLMQNRIDDKSTKIMTKSGSAGGGEYDTNFGS